jgi:hypothetical protein
MYLSENLIIVFISAKSITSVLLAISLFQLIRALIKYSNEDYFEYAVNIYTPLIKLFTFVSFDELLNFQTINVSNEGLRNYFNAIASKTWNIFFKYSLHILVTSHNRSHF